MGCVQSESQTIVASRVPPRSYSRATSASHRKTAKPSFVSRLSTKYQQTQIKQITEQQKINGFKPLYTCPICFLYFDKILACSNCSNCLCRSCFEGHEQKWKRRTKCPFCFSNKSMFVDYELEPHSYFDSSNKGFISREQREKLDRQILAAISKNTNTISRPIKTAKEIPQN